MMTDRHAAYLARTHFGALNGIRAISIIAVLWHHGDISFEGNSVLSRGFLGVDLFFVISGFLIVTLLLRERGRFGNISLGQFYIRRALRIFPVYYALLFALAVAYAFKAGDPDAGRFYGLLPLYALYVSNWSIAQAANLSVLWSLATEEQFYLIWPAIEKFLSEKAAWCVLAIVLIINQLINFGALDGLFAWIYDRPEAPDLAILDTTFTPILLGVVLAHLLHRPTGFSAVARLVSQPVSPAVIMGLLIGVLAIAPDDISGVPRLVIHLLMMALIASVVITERHVLSLLLEFAPLEWTGRISYGMYLFHLWVFFVTGEVLAALSVSFPGMIFIIGGLATIALASLSFRFFEMRFLQLKPSRLPSRYAQSSAP